MKPENIFLNRYNSLYPYDHSRVKIAALPRFFINACYIDGYNNKKKAYIASLGPTSKTTDKFSNFWLMVWHERSDIIVMLTNLRELSGMKCEKYWPNSDEEQLYGQITVKCRSVEEFAEYTVRTFTISKKKEERNVIHLHYTAWPDKGVPQEVTSLVEFRQRVKSVPVTLGGPVIAHCSAGVGRTGTYIALDILTEEGKDLGSVDVFNCVNKMRGQRVNMVQTGEQYMFLHKALVHSLTFDCETLTAEAIQAIVYEADEQKFTDMYQILQREVDTECQDDLDDREENRKRHNNKNRRHSEIPANRSRVRLFVARSHHSSHDYINAVFISSFKTKNLFIAAQSPLAGTIEDFVCMIYQQNCACVIALDQPFKQGDNDGQYLPADNKTYICGNFTVTSSKCETKQQFVVKKLTITHTNQSEVKTVYHFQYKKWAESNTVPDTVEDFVHFIKDVEKRVNHHTNNNSHVVVHCLTGYERSGLFCTLYSLLEKLEAERQVSLVNMIRKIRTHRRQAITGVEQLKFCFRCVSAYLEIYNTYSNFAT
ncbi:receptor-type tyrosine-protein phosphatase alpha-like [Ruditapes philippinarum]|uniref:receptor-type tyrosine-protein phosphatase alpha-like n=1 Tax=Ruditapes philippinarum TaxID=129788 RepID=UPI00295B9597|nr:receptor-type tyrosine-protein phosphatase alpha-like [Ruditapes philippinarum]